MIYILENDYRIIIFQVSIMGRGIEEKLSARRDKSHVLFGGTKILQHTLDKVVYVRTYALTKKKTN